MYRVLFAHEAEKQYNRQDRPTKRRINEAIESLKREPHSGPHIRRLVGELEGNWRYRLGGLRIIYEIDDDQNIVKVKTIKSRGDVY